MACLISLCWYSNPLGGPPLPVQSPCLGFEFGAWGRRKQRKDIQEYHMLAFHYVESYHGRASQRFHVVCRLLFLELRPAKPLLQGPWKFPKPVVAIFITSISICICIRTRTHIRLSVSFSLPQILSSEMFVREESSDLGAWLKAPETVAVTQKVGFGVTVRLFMTLQRPAASCGTPSMPPAWRWEIGCG